MTKFLANRALIGAAVVTLLLSGCFKEDRVAADPASGSSGSAAAPPTSTNSKPTISGTPPTSVLEGDTYDFQPSASDPDGDRLTFSVSNKPTWASFDAATGRLYGTPGAGTSGSYSNIVITVSDGKAQASLSGYTLTVEQIATGSATLSWNPPTQNTDGSALTDLAGYKIYYGKSSTNLDKVVTIASAGVTRYVVENLTSATWYFSMTSYNSTGIESSRSTAVSKTIG